MSGENRAAITVCHMTSVHSRADVRIFLKECCSLAKAGYRVCLVVADGQGDANVSGISIKDAGRPSGRLARMLTTTRNVLRIALAQNADIYHFHDPELLPAGRKLKRLGKTVIFDAHEDIAKQLASKPYLNRIARIVVPPLIEGYERRVCTRLDAIVTATAHIRDKFRKINANVADINNYPLRGELYTPEVDWSIKLPQVCYIGGITEIRGIFPLVKAMEYVTKADRLVIAGRFAESSVDTAAHAMPGWRKVDERGFVDRENVRDILAHSVAGLVTFLGVPNHINDQPNKMFEYMSAGLPVIASNFPLWREIIEGNDCGICVDPEQPAEIAEAIDYLATHPERAMQMGVNGRVAVQERYNWDNEVPKLLELYSRLAT
jgi:glycosyltransferase involved in cell wall biosynthesis